MKTSKLVKVALIAITLSACGAALTATTTPPASVRSAGVGGDPGTHNGLAPAVLATGAFTISPTR